MCGVNSDEDILLNKGPPILNCKERADIIRACKWVDEVYEGTEYVVSIDTLDRYKCDYYAHGDDPVFGPNGENMCEILSNVGRFKMFKRTEGVSTTDIVGKLLMLTTQESAKGIGRDRANSSSEKPMRTSEYLSEARKKKEEDLKIEEENSTLQTPVASFDSDTLQM